jgi:serine/threonine-protein kinase
MGVVYLAEHTGLRNRVALKLLHPELTRVPQAVNRFFREARATTELTCRHIVEVTDFGRTEDKDCYLVMELLSGLSLKDVLKREKRLPVFRAIKIAVQIAEALDAAHEKGVIHRDLKPSNIQLTWHAGDPDFVKLFDFGIAKIIAEGGPELTRTGMVLGSPSYMSPEQAVGKRVDHRTDIYALGIVLYEMLAGSPPFIGENPPQIVLAQVNENPPSLQAIQPGVPAAVEQLVLDCLAKDPEKRPTTAAAVRDTLQAWLDSPRRPAAQPVVIGATGASEQISGAETLPLISAQAPIEPAVVPGEPPPRPRRGRLPLLVAGGAVVVLAAIAGIWYGISIHRDDAPEVAVGHGRPLRAAAAPAPPRRPGPDAARIPASAPASQPVEESADSDDLLSQIPTPVSADRERPEVVILSARDGAQIFEDTRLLGTTPMKLSSEKPMQLTLKRKGYQPVRLNISTNTTGILSVELVKIPKKRPRQRVKRRARRRRKRRGRRRRLHSLSKLRRLYRKRRISRAQYRRIARYLVRQRRRRLRTIYRMYRSRRLSRAQYRRYARAIRRYYR